MEGSPSFARLTKQVQTESVWATRLMDGGLRKLRPDGCSWRVTTVRRLLRYSKETADRL
jgi:hypothetical protein